MLRACLLCAVVVGAGCGEMEKHIAIVAAPPASTTAPIPRKSFVDTPDIRQIPPNIDVRGCALTWDELLATEKPDLVIRPPGYVDGHDLLWLQRGPKGEPAFRLERAFLWKPRAGTTCWVMFSPPKSNWWEIDLDVELIDTHITATKQKPRADGPINYAVPLAIDRLAGTIYEIGWTSCAGRGSGMCTGQRNLYLWQHADGSWQYVGEGEGTSSSHSMREGSRLELESSAVFVGKPGVPRIVLEYRDTSEELGESQVGLASITEERDYMLMPGENGSPGVPQLVGKTLYTLAWEGATLDSMACAVAMRDMGSQLAEANPRWHHVDKESRSQTETAENAAQQRQARAMLERMNPGIATRPVEPGAKVFVSREF
jgi:hypothetical protein